MSMNNSINFFAAAVGAVSKPWVESNDTFRFVEAVESVLQCVEIDGQNAFSDDELSHRSLDDVLDNQ